MNKKWFNPEPVFGFCHLIMCFRCFKFENEENHGEWLKLLGNEVFSPNYGLFTSASNNMSI